MQRGKTNSSYFWKIVLLEYKKLGIENLESQLADFHFENRNLLLLKAFSLEDVKNLFNEHDNIALLILDCRSNYKSQLKMVEHIRENLNNAAVRIFLLIEDNLLFEEKSFEKYEVNGFIFEKDIISQKLPIILNSSLRSYRDLSNLKMYKIKLEEVLALSQELFQFKEVKKLIQKIFHFLPTLLFQDSKFINQEFSGFCSLNNESSNYFMISYATGIFKKDIHKDIFNVLEPNLQRLVKQSLKEKRTILIQNHYIGYFKNRNYLECLIYLNLNSFPNEEEKKILMLFSLNAAFAFENISLVESLDKTLQKSHYLERSKSDFLSIISHELKTPLTPIIGYSQWLLSYELKDPDFKEACSIIFQSGQKLNRMVEHLLSASDLGDSSIPIQKEYFDLYPLITEVYSLLNERFSQKNLIFEIELKQNASIYSDRFKIKQILYNLLDNALKFTNQGSIWFIHKEEEQNHIFQIKDSGIGIAKEKQQIIFEHFKQLENVNSRRYEGVGAGLNICRKLILELNGAIWLESQIKKGSNFYFSIPKEN